MNVNQEVWLYDLESTHGTYVDGERVKGRAFLLGVHDVLVGEVPLRIASSSDLLIYLLGGRFCNSNKRLSHQC